MANEERPADPDPTGDGGGFFSNWPRHLELFATILLAIAAVATAWSSYQSARWSGVQAIEFSASTSKRVESTRSSDEAGQFAQADLLTYTQWVNAYAEGNRELSDFYLSRFRPEFKPAVTAWIETRPLKNANAPPSPFVMPEYSSSKEEEADRLLDEAEQANADAREANQRSDNYVLAVVLFAAALFFAGISTKLTRDRQRGALLTFGYLLFFGTLIWIATFPISFGL